MRYALLVFCLTFQTSFSQNTDIRKVTYKRNEDKSVTFSFNGETAGTTYVILKLSQLSNTTTPEVVRRSVRGFSGTLVTLFPDNKDQHISFSYSYRMLTGDIDAKPDRAFKYVLPFKKGKEVRVKHLGFLGKKLGGKTPKNFAAFQFLANENDTVCAIRKGVVVRIKDGYNSSKDGEFSYKSQANSILIEHEDGTMASYQVLKRGSFMVKVGDVVYPSTPLAIAGTYDKTENSQVRISVYYLDDIIRHYDFDSRGEESFAKSTHLNAYVNPLFIVNSDGSGLLNLNNNEAYTSFYTDDIIQSEMTKREKKRCLKKRKSTVP